jgi:hypothetical protein
MPFRNFVQNSMPNGMPEKESRTAVFCDANMPNGMLALSCIVYIQAKPAVLTAGLNG